MEKKALNAEIGGLQSEALDTRRGQIFGLFIGLTAIIAGRKAPQASDEEQQTKDLTTSKGE